MPATVAFPRKTATYFIHDGDKRPYAAKIRGMEVKVYKFFKYNEETDEFEFEIKPFVKFVAQQIFIGKSVRSPSTEINDTYGKFFDGNSILIKTGLKTYNLISSKIFRIEPTRGEFIFFNSPVDENLISHPYAIDTNHTYYLFEDNAVYELEAEEVSDPTAPYLSL